MIENHDFERDYPSFCNLYFRRSQSMFEELHPTFFITLVLKYYVKPYITSFKSKKRLLKYD